MGQPILADGEYLAARFRPHWASRAGPVGAAAAWILAAALAVYASFAEWFGSPIGGILFFAAFAVVVATRRWRQVRRGRALWALLWATLSVLLALLQYSAPAALPAEPWILLLVMGAVAAGPIILEVEVIRRRQLHYVTDRRLILQEGVRRRHEETLEWERVDQVRGHQNVLGQLFRFGTVELVLHKSGRQKTDAPAATMALAGVPAYTRTKHVIEGFVADARGHTRDRTKRVEERRMKDSMQALAQWVHQERS